MMQCAHSGEGACYPVQWESVCNPRPAWKWSQSSIETETAESGIEAETSESHFEAETSVEVQVRGIAGPLCKLRIGPLDLREHVQSMIQAETGIDFWSQRLFCGVREMLHDECVGSLLVGTSGPVDLLLVKRTQQQAGWLQELCSCVDPVKFLRKYPEARSDYGVILELVVLAAGRGEVALPYASESLRADRGIVLAAVSREARNLRWAAEELKADHEIVLAAVTHNGGSLEWAAEELRADREIVLTAIAHNGRHLRWAAEKLRADRDVVLAAVTHHSKGGNLRWASKELRADRDVILAARCDYRNFVHALIQL